MKNILLTGGAGFIGSHLAEKFAEEGYSLVIVDNLFRGKRENIQHLLKKGNSLFEYDLVDYDSIDALKALILEYRPSYILHYAAINGTQYFYDIPEKVAEVNSIGTYNLLKALTAANNENQQIKPLLVFASTSETYGEPFQLPTKEDDVTYARISEIRDSYAVAKLMSEFYVKLYAQKLGFDFIIFRIFNVYGPRMIGTRYGQVIPEFVQRLELGEYPLNILGNGAHTRSFIYVDDHVALTYAAVTKAKRNEVYNLGNPTETSIIDLARLTMTKLGMEPKFNFLPERSGDHKRRVPDITKLLNQIGEFRFTTLEEGLDQMLQN